MIECISSCFKDFEGILDHDNSVFEKDINKKKS